MAPHGNPDSGDRLHGGTMLDEGAPPWVGCSRKEWLASADGFRPFAESRRECGKLLDCSGNRAAGAELWATAEMRER